MSEWGKVVGVKGKNAILSMRKSEECDNCKRCRPGRTDDEMIAEAKNKIGADVGDTVEVSYRVITGFESILVQFGIPFCDGIIGAVIGYIIAILLKQNENIIAWVITTGVVFMIISFILSKKVFAELKDLKSKRLIINSIISKD